MQHEQDRNGQNIQNPTVGLNWIKGMFHQDYPNQSNISEHIWTLLNISWLPRKIKLGPASGLSQTLTSEDPERLSKDSMVDSSMSSMICGSSHFGFGDVWRRLKGDCVIHLVLNFTKNLWDFVEILHLDIQYLDILKKVVGESHSLNKDVKDVREVKDVQDVKDVKGGCSCRRGTRKRRGSWFRRSTGKSWAVPSRISASADKTFRK